MPLEATVCMLDNSEYAINSDVIPTRLEAASDAIKTIFKAKTNSNPESTCGLMTFAGKSPTVLVTPTTDEGKIHVSLQSIKPHGTPDLISGLSVAGLALKHRQEKNQRQRAIVLLSSPLPPNITSEDLARLGKKLKKNNVAVDVILFGSEVEINEERMKSFVEAVESSGNSKIIIVPGGSPGLLSDYIKQSDLLAEEGFGSGASLAPGPASGSGPAGVGEAAGLDIDPNLDPELAMALRMSLQEEEARQAASNRQQATQSNNSQPQAVSASLGDTNSSKEIVSAEKEAGSSSAVEDDELSKALGMSRGEDVAMEDGEGESKRKEDEDEDEDEAIARAIEMSMKGNGNDDGSIDQLKKK
ncbi:hypothetical protein PPACK8108_LOCUS13116 [Phakopsora pachyrhizi]|uniref:VWFA domain-containing protein n=1 Tax=Phakopsora pachyrhizi TaxID=170000 RepID=A0AAV0B645_PHAPC|nr:hypothetical protein PPACK8108_LOCUS13116 [Phakopsora pachyrhizi]